MKVVFGIDIGGSTTKIVIFDEDRRILDKLQIEATEQTASLYSAIESVLQKNSLKFEQVLRFILTGVGAASIIEDIHNIPTCKVKEFEAIGFGGLILSGLSEALVVSVGTGTAFVRADSEKSVHIGGSGIGGGTLLGLSKELFSQDDIETIMAIAGKGDLKNVDLSLGEISRNSDISSLPIDATASNFGKIKNTASGSDMALGLMNMIFQTIGMLSVFACMDTAQKNVVVTGSVATLPQAKRFLDEVGAFYKLNFIIPKDAMFATAIGASAFYFDELEQEIK